MQERNRAELERNRALEGVQTTSSLVGDLLSQGILPTDVAQQLLTVPSRIVNDLEGEHEDSATLTVEWQLYDILSSAYLDVPGGGETGLNMANKMKTISGKLAAGAPSIEEYQKDFINSHARIGDAYEYKGDFDAAMISYKNALSAATKLIQADPSNPDLQRDLLYIYERMGDDLYAKQDFSGALGDYMNFLIIAQTLSQRIDVKPEWIRRLALAQERVGDALRNLGQPNEALSHYLAYQQAAQKLMKKESPTSPNFTWRLDLLISYERMGAVQLINDDYDNALKNYIIYNEGVGDIAVRNTEQGQWQRSLQMDISAWAMSCLPRAISMTR